MTNYHEMTRGRVKKIDAHITFGGADEDITAAQGLYFAARTAPGVTPAIFQKSLGDGITITNGPLGRAQIVIAPSDTVSLSPKQIANLFFEFAYKNAAGELYEIADGRLIVTPNIVEVA